MACRSIFNINIIYVKYLGRVRAVIFLNLRRLICGRNSLFLIRIKVIFVKLFRLWNVNLFKNAVSLSIIHYDAFLSSNNDSILIIFNDLIKNINYISEAFFFHKLFSNFLNIKPRNYVDGGKCDQDVTYEECIWALTFNIVPYLVEISCGWLS